MMKIPIKSAVESIDFPTRVGKSLILHIRDTHSPECVHKQTKHLNL